MRAKQNFTVYVDSNKNMIPHSCTDSIEGKTKIDVKIGDEVPDFLVAEFLKSNPDYLQVEYEAGQLKLTDEELVKYNLKSRKIEREPFIKPRKYSQDSLTKILNKDGKDALAKIMKEEFGIEVKPSKKLLVEILRLQEQRRRGG